VIRSETFDEYYLALQRWENEGGAALAPYDAVSIDDLSSVNPASGGLGPRARPGVAGAPASVPRSCSFVATSAS
jgi:hypothetical protein